jgi:hypothetical protein
VALEIRRLLQEDDRSGFRSGNVDEKLGFIDLGARAGQLGDRPEPRPMFLELGAIPKPSAS